MSTIQASTLRSQLVSTVAGLGQSDYVSTSYLNLALDFLSLSHGYYISSTTLYDVILSLSNMTRIDGLGPIPNATGGSNLMSGGYVHTVNPGKYTVYQSSLRSGHQISVAMIQGVGVPGAVADIGGYRNNFVNKSKLTLDVFNGATVTFAGGAIAGTAVSTFLVSTNTGGMIIGDPVVYNVPTNSPSLAIPMTRFLLQPSNINLANVPTSLTVAYCTNTTNATITGNVPSIGGMFVTLNNLD
jgi:hypothetical protein